VPNLTRSEIEALIPHRAPFLWLDEVLELAPDRLRARKRVDPALDVFAGHYPRFPVLPGVLLCESAFQAGAVLIASSATLDQGRVPVVTRLNNVKFRRLVRPGETLDIEVELTERLADAFFLTGRVSVAGETAVRLEFACAAVAP
jgi:3-hydroxyacyl-[acyl-carrier-protein] dehydratase